MSGGLEPAANHPAALPAGLAGCRGANEFRAARDCFSAAARWENTQQRQSFLGGGANFGDPAGGAERALTDLSAARNGYAAAILSLDRISAKDRARLEEDQIGRAHV